MSIDAINNNNNAAMRSEANIGISQAGRVRESIKPVKVANEKKPIATEKIELAYPGDKKISQEEVIETIEKANKEFIGYDRRFEFSIHEKTKQIMVKVIDSTNDEVIRELPPEKVLDMVAAMWEIAGILVDEKA